MSELDDIRPPDLDQARRFLQILDPNADMRSIIENRPDGFTFQTFDDSKTRKDRTMIRIFTNTLGGAADTLTTLNKRGAGIFVTVNETDGRGRKLANLERIRCVWVEDDEGLGIAAPLEPHLVTETSPGKFHKLFLVDGLTVEQHARVQDVLVAEYGSDPNAKDAVRVLRVPGFYHMKGKPFMVRLIHESCTRPYTAEQVLEAFGISKNYSPPNKSIKVTSTAPHVRSDYIFEGGRNAFLTSEAGRMRRAGMDESQLLAGLLEINQQKCDPPLDDSEIANIARSIAKYPDGLDEINEGTELALANYLKVMVDGSVRYLVTRGCFVIWNNNRWQIDSDGSLLMSGYEWLLKSFTESILTESQYSRRESRLKLLLKLQQRKTIENISALLKKLPGIPIGLDEFDAAPLIFQVANGVINLKTGLFRPVTKEDYCLLSSPVEYDPKATCPRFKQLLLWAMNDDQSRADFMRRLAGYLLVGHAQEEILPIFQGGGANGKSTVREALRRVLGTYASVAQPGLLVNRDASAQSNDIARLAGMRVVFVSETDENDRLAESTVKYITQQEPITARFLHQEFFTFVPRFKCLLATNHKPIVRGSDGGIWRRLILIPFENSLPEDQRDVHFVEKFLVPELPGILNWMISGAIDYNKVGLKIPASIKAATDEYREKSDVYGEFFTDCLSESDSSTLTNANIWTAFTYWYHQAFGSDSPPWLNIRGLGRWLADRGYKPSRGAGGARGYHGLKLKLGQN